MWLESHRNQNLSLFHPRVFQHWSSYINIPLCSSFRVTCQIPQHHQHHQPVPPPTQPQDLLTHFIAGYSSFSRAAGTEVCHLLIVRVIFFKKRMAPKREPSIKSPSLVTRTRLGPPYPCIPAAPAGPKQALEQKPKMLRASDTPFDPSTLEVSMPYRVNCFHW